MRLGKFLNSKPASPKIFILLTVLTEVIMGGMLFPITPYFVERFRSDAFTIGLLASTFATAQFIAAPVLGALSDRIGRRPILLMSTAGSSLASYIFGFANALWLLFLSRIFNGLTGGVISTAQAYLVDISESEQERTKNFGLIGATLGLGFILGLALGGSLGAINIKLPIFFAGTVALMNTIFGYYHLKESLIHKIEKPIRITNLNPFTHLAELLRRNQVRNLLLGLFIYKFAFIGCTKISVIFLRDRFGWDPIQAASLFVVAGIVSAVVQGVLIRKIVPIFGEMKVALTGLLFFSVALVLIPLAPFGILLYGIQVTLALGDGLAFPSLQGLLANSVAEQEQGKINGGSESLMSLGIMLAPLISTFSYDRLGMEAPFWGATLLVLLAIVVIVQNRSAMKSASP